MKLRNRKSEVRPGDPDEVMFLVSEAQAIIHERWVVSLDRNEDDGPATYTVSVIEYIPFVHHGFHLGAKWVASDWGNSEKAYFKSKYSAYACFNSTCSHLL